jgi:hypothetical protein
MSAGIRFLILNTDYPEFLRWLYQRHRGLERQPYDEQMRVRNESLFGVADSYSSNLQKLGHEAHDIHANNEPLQKAWARQHRLPIEEPAAMSARWRGSLQKAKRLAAKTALRHLKPLFRPMLRRLNKQPAWFHEVLAAQIKHYKPDVLLNQDMDSICVEFMREFRPQVRLLVGQIASPIPAKEEFKYYDLIISSLPNFVADFRQMGLCAELHRLGFEPRILRELNDEDSTIPISFIGSFSRHHQARVRLLEHLCVRLPVKVWGQGLEDLPKNSPIRQCYMGQAWGIEMYQILRNSKMTLNYHIGAAGSYANNMRLFEATGVGTLLVTDWKDNLGELFVPGKELVAYRSPEQCAKLLEHYMEHGGQRKAIAQAGQQRTLREHTYYHRMEELVAIIGKYL